MLRLSDIRKEYPAGDGKVEALRGVSIEFRESERRCRTYAGGARNAYRGAYLRNEDCGCGA